MTGPSGTFTASGWENDHQVARLALFLSSGSVLVFLYLSYQNWYISLVGLDLAAIFFYLSLGWIIVAWVGLAILVQAAKRTEGTYDITYVDNRGLGGGLELSWTVRSKGIRRESVGVERVDPDAKNGLQKPTMNLVPLVTGGTKASMIVYFTRHAGPRKLQLGFPNPEEMDKVYQLLK